MGSNNKWRIVTVAFVLFSGCGPSVTFENPLVDPMKAPVYPELFGVYPIPEDMEAQESFFCISPAGAGFPKGFLRIEGLVSAADGRVELTDFSMLGFCVKHGRDYYFHIPLREPLEGAEENIFRDDWAATETVGYGIDIWSFDADGNSFKWLRFNSDYLAEQIAEGHLRGNVVYDDQQLQEGEVQQLQSVHVTASKDELWRFLRFVKKHELGELAIEALGEFQKLQFPTKIE